MVTSADRSGETTTRDQSTPSVDRAGTTIGKYRIESKIGEGGMGQVYRAKDMVLRRSVALKVLHADKSGDRDSALRLLREARAAAALSHTNAVLVFDVGEVEGLAFIAMELLSGTTLRAYVHDSRVTLDRKLRWILQAARALDAAHRAGLMHRDVKPENILVCEDDTIKVLDFGLAKRMIGPQEVFETSAPPAEPPSSFRTQEGRVCGTPRYMAPEQLLGSPSEQSDQFSWGLVAYELLTGNAFDDLEPKRPHEACPEVPLSLSAIIMRAIDPSPTRRFATMKAVVAALEKEERAFAAGSGGQMALAPTVESPNGPASDEQTTVADGAQRRPSGGAAPSVAAETGAPARRRVLVLGLLAVGALSAGGAWWRYSGRSAPEAANVEPLTGRPPTCLPGTYWDGDMCSPYFDTTCPPGTGFVATVGCSPATEALAARPPCPAGMSSVPGGMFLPPNASAKVTIHTFCLDSTEVTVAAYAACVRAGACTDDHTAEVRGPDPVPLIDDQRCNLRVAGRDEHPMNCVDWHQANAYCRAQGRRLPDAEEWGWAARGGERGTRYPWGNDAPANQLCWSGITPRDGTCPVASFPAGDAPGGIHDVAGNVWEFVGTTGEAPPGTLLGHGACLFAGGAWSHVGPANFRAVTVNWGAPDVRAADIGFRCAM